MRLLPDEDGSFECLLHYYDATPRSGIDSGTFESAVAGAEQEFTRWSSWFPRGQPELEYTRRLAAYVLWSNTVGPRGLYHEPVVWCSKSWMNRIWSWDHCFVAVGLAPSMHELAWQQWALFRDMQDPASGMLGRLVQQCAAQLAMHQASCTWLGAPSPAPIHAGDERTVAPTL